MNEKPMSSAQMKAWPGAKEADGLQQELGTEPRPTEDASLFALVLENNRLLKALTERLTPKAEPTRWTLDGRLNDVSVPGETSPEQTLERLIRDAGAKSRWGHPSKPLTVSDMAHVLSTGEVPPAYSVTERLVRGQVADRLKAVLLPSPDEARPSLSLDEALQAVKVRLDAGREWFRNAALEEAAVTALGMAEWGWPAREAIAAAIRALKSKPAPQPSGISGELLVQCLVPGCDRPHQHEGAHESCGRARE